MRTLTLYFLVLIAQQSVAQKVALVLSGGGAKGIAHVGVLKALEENNIPIDYIVGTSMGGIVGGCYAAGMSPQEIESMILSEDFMRWMTGQPEKGYNFYYYNRDYDPGFLHLTLSADSTTSFHFNQSLANDASLNFAITEKMTMASAISKNNFDSLFVPLRVIAADVFAQRQVILDSGSLSAALRATHTVPFFYSPIRIDGKYLFDGGIYNNFPVDVAQKHFNPDVIIGSNVSSKIFKEYPFEDDDKLINKSLFYMILDKSDPDDVPDSGVYIQPNLEDYSSFDFAKARNLIDSGYFQTLRQLEEIKSKVSITQSSKSITEKRKQFKDKAVPMTFDQISLNGFNSSQQKYILRIFKVRPNTKQNLNLENLKEGYFKLVGEPYFSNIYPNIQFLPDAGKFQLQLSRRPQKNFQVDFGGVLASRNISNIYLGANYYYFNSSLTHVYVGAQSGSFYKSIEGNVRIDFPFLSRFYLRPEIEYHDWDYVGSADLLQKVSPTVLKRFDRKLALRVGLPIGNSIKGNMVITGFNNTDRYSNNKTFNSLDTLDELKLRGLRVGFILSTSSLDRKQYPSAGKSFLLGAYYFNAKELYTPGTTSVNQQEVERTHQWFRIKATAEQYANRGWFRPGYLVEGVFSNQPFFTNYFGTIINAPSFFPLQDSRTLILENFRSTNYLAVGSRNVFILRKRILDLRVEGYLFKPIEYIQEGNNQEAFANTEISKVFFSGTAGLVYHSPVGPVSLSMNYYDDAENQIGVLFHVGFLLFGKHTLE